MATTTPNYGWTVPTSTDLVKDGATAIETLGDAIDASMNTALGTKKAGMVLLNTTSFSGVTSVSFPTDTFTSTYDRFLVTWYLTTVTSSVREIGLRLRLAGSDISSAAAYSNQNFGVNTLGSTSAVGSTRTYVRMGYSESTTDKTSGHIYLPRTTSEVNKTLYGDVQGDDGSGNKQRSMFGALVNVTTAYDSISIINLGATNMSGKMSVYGFNQ